MGNKINTFFGFKFDKGILKSVVGGLNDVRVSSVRAALGIDDINKGLKKMYRAQSFIALGLAAKNAAGSIKSAFAGIQQVYTKFVDVAGRGDHVAKTSKMLGVTVDEYQALASAAKHSGMSVEEFDSAFKKFNVTLGKARVGDKLSAKKITSLLPKGAKLADYRDVSSVIADVADGYTKLQSAEQKAFVSQELFGKSGQKMSELFKDGSNGLFQAYKDFKENGGGFDEEGAENAELFNDELQKVQESFDSLKVSVMQELFPTFINMFKFIRNYLKESGSDLKTKLVEIGKAVSSFVIDILPKIPGYIDNIFKIVDKIGTKTTALVGIVGYFSPALVNIVILAGAVAKAVYSIGKVLFSVIKWVTKITALTTVLWATWTAIKLTFLTLGAGAFFGTFGGVLAVLVEIGIIVKQIYDNWDMLRTLTFDEFFNAVKMWISEIAESCGEVFSFIAESVSGFFMDKLNGLLNFMGKIKSSILGLFSGFPNKVKKFFGIGDVDVNLNPSGTQSTLAASAAQAISESHTTVTNRFAVDFNNVPRGTKITPPPKGDFDWSRGYMLGGI
jgi:hypothetical protein